ncbi:MAG: gamma-glutamyltransferase [Candidatus Tectomicrobia bacterium]|nr:gamma-glutamyltransferase [Candidatus Tectomicrobia bacterium]
MAFRHRLPDGREYLSHRPQVTGRRAMVASGHHLATQAGLRILDRGGNAVDAGVAAGLCMSVLLTDMISFLGVAPIILYLAGEKRVVTISGLGRWPRAASIRWFREKWGGEIPPGVARCVVPAAADAWLTALERYGTMRFAEVAADAAELAGRGFPMHHFMHEHITEGRENYHRFPENRPVYFPGGELAPVGSPVFHRELAETFGRMARAEAKTGSRPAGIRAAREEIYRGETARRIVDFIQKNGGAMTLEDLADFHVKEEPPVVSTYKGHEVFACGPWCQGASLPQALNLLETVDLQALGHNRPAYLHALFAAFDLAFADRHAYLGDPEFVEVPIEGLLSKGYAAERARLLAREEAFGQMPPAGDPWAFQRNGNGRKATDFGLKETAGAGAFEQDTSFCTAVDAEGNAFAATPSDGSADVPIFPGVGAAVSGRGSQSWLEEAHPSSVQPWKRPRLTPAPALVMKDGQFHMTLGTPGGDVQPQAMAQVFLNIVEFGMAPQMATEAPRGATFNFPNSFWPHEYKPGRAVVEQSIEREAGAELRARGYKLDAWPDYGWRPGGVCCILRDPKTGLLLGGADPRRESYAAGW